MRNIEDRAHRLHARFDGSSADGNSVRTNCRFQQHFGYDGGTKAQHYHQSECESGAGSNHFSQQHIAQHAIAGQHRESNPANCFSCAADGLTDAGNYFSNFEFNHHPGWNARDRSQPVRDAGHKRYGFQSDYCDSWISASGKLQHSGNYHRSARKRKSSDYGIGNREPLPDYADYKSTDT